MSNKHPALKAVPIVKNGRPVWAQHKLWSEMRAADVVLEAVTS